MKRPDIILHWRDVESKTRAVAHHDGEAFGFNSPIGSKTGLSRLMVSHLRLPPGSRSNIPNAARDEEQFWFVLEGEPDFRAVAESITSSLTTPATMTERIETALRRLLSPAAVERVCRAGTEIKGLDRDIVEAKGKCIAWPDRRGGGGVAENL